MVHVWRLETKKGKGPYSGSFNIDWEAPPSYLEAEYAGRTGANDPHPAPSEDGLEIIYSWHFGFESIASMQAWFCAEPYDPERLEALGLFVTEWVVPDRAVRAGRKQVIFCKAKSTCVQVTTPTRFFAELEVQNGQ